MVSVMNAISPRRNVLYSVFLVFFFSHLARAKLNLGYELRIPALSVLKSKAPTCDGLPDGAYPDLRTIIPCSRYYKCMKGKIMQSMECKEGTFFSRHVIGGCGPRHLSACRFPQSDADSGKPSPQLRQHRQLVVSKLSKDEITLLKLKEFVVSDPYMDFLGLNATSKPCDADAIITCKNRRITGVGFSSITFSSFKEIIPIFAELKSLKTLKLSSADLKGIIPPEIKQLSHLTSLWLDGNQLLAPLPAEFASLKKLTELVLSSNPIGEIPSVVYSMPSLTYLDFSSTKLTGVIPQNISSLKKLTTLSLAENSLEGSIPNDICSFSNMENLDLSYNLLTGEIPDELGNCSLSVQLSGNFLSGSIPAASLCRKKSMTGIFLAVNNLTGTLSDELGSCPLQSLDLHNNMLQGGIPAKLIKKLAPTISMLDLSNNPLGGVIPSALSSASFLSSLILTNTSLSGEIPDIFDKLMSLSVLHLSSNDLSGTIPPLGSHFLLNLDLSSNKLSGVIPKELSKLGFLSWLDLHDNQFVGPIPKLSNLIALENLYLQQNLLNGSIPSDFGNNGALKSLNLSYNSLSGSIPSALGGIISLTVLDLSHNQLSGEIPPSLSMLNASLSLLYLNDNQLSGTFPSWLEYFHNLTALHVENNRLSGFVPLSADGLPSIVDINISNNSFSGNPPEFSSSSTVGSIDISRNSFSGSLPLWLYSLSSIQTLNFSYNLLTGSISSDIGRLYSLLVLDLSNNNISGSIPSEVSNSTQLLTLNLKDNRFEGSIPESMGSLTSLTYLDLSRNLLNGRIPGTFAFLTSLQYLNVSENDLSGSIPDQLSSFGESSFSGNSLCGQPMGGCGSSVNVGLIVGIVIGCVLVLAVLMVIVFLVLFFFWKKKNQFKGEGEFLLFQSLPFSVNYDILISATNNFDEKYKLGAGGFGAVYKAELNGGKMEVAVKKLMETSRRDEELKAEIQTLGKIRHRNLVTLIGAYIHPATHETFLVYNYLNGGNLDSYLTGSKAGKGSLFSSWSIRHQVALGTARGFKYLHHECNPAIVHRDIKPANILIDEHMEAYVADFGLAKVVDSTKTHMSTSVLGTIGYFAPEYTQRGHLTIKSDVFSFGIVLLQILTGKRPTNVEIAELGGLALWVARNTPQSVIDPNLELKDDDEMDEVLACLKLGLLCTAKKPSDRPTMADVVQVLENLSSFAEEIQMSVENTPSSVSSFPWGGRTGSTFNSNSLSGFGMHSS